MRRPTTSFSRSRRITSTSGSSTCPLLRVARVSADRRANASWAACCSASFFDRPVPRPYGSPAEVHGGRELLLVVGTAHRAAGTRAASAAPATPAPGGSSCSRGRPRRGRRPPCAGGRAARPARERRPARGRGRPRPSTASRASARMLALSRPPDCSSPLPSSTVVAEAERARHVGERRHVHDGRAELRERSLRHVRGSPVRHVGDDDAEHRVAEELEALVRHASARARTRRSGG